MFKVSSTNVSVNQTTCNNGTAIADYGVNLLGAKGSPGKCVYD